MMIIIVVLWVFSSFSTLQYFLISRPRVWVLFCPPSGGQETRAFLSCMNSLKLTKLDSDWLKLTKNCSILTKITWQNNTEERPPGIPFQSFFGFSSERLLWPRCNAIDAASLEWENSCQWKPPWTSEFILELHQLSVRFRSLSIGSPLWFEQLLLGSFVLGSLRQVVAYLCGSAKTWKFLYQNHPRKVCYTNVQTVHVELPINLCPNDSLLFSPLHSVLGRFSSPYYELP